MAAAINAKLIEARGYPQIQGPLTEVTEFRSNGNLDSKQYWYGFDIYQDAQTGADGSYFGILYGRTPSKETSIWMVRSPTAQQTPAATSRIDALATNLHQRAATLRGMM